ncbi:hypothetical protein CHO01_17280 [Cellulomonas hominis]|uniref:Uncharacterized protein n=1 Tax=Cellulomonas hominis TaxID=156981 RepID=A0A511FBK3_9CELL|nr:hypothetical protein [Cellulomonas hominis]MBB5474573.1 hypothetical protein [Cellulomonas hominis]NKY05583.1 hypothetical protein [Cellulomonas hominis]GEL46612.1 hypothetical protein CHO01_17280 [Cellulomonas hominis]
MNAPRTPQNRQPAGISIGGQFATTPRDEAAITLVPDQPVHGDANALDEIGRILGLDEQWDGAADYLDAIAEEIASTGRPHPGGDAYEAIQEDDEASNPEYDTALETWKAANPEPADPRAAKDWRLLNFLGRHLAATESWSSDDLQVASDAVRNSGRPSPGDTGLFGAAYAKALRAWNIEQGLAQPGVGEHLEQIAAQADLAHMADFVGIVLNREEVPADVLAGLTADDLVSLHEDYFAPAITDAAAYVAEAADAGRSLVATGWGKPEPIEPGTGAQFARDLGARAGCESAGDALALALAEGRITEEQLSHMGEADVEDLYERHIGPAADALEARLLRGL